MNEKISIHAQEWLKATGYIEESVLLSVCNAVTYRTIANTYHIDIMGQELIVSFDPGLVHLFTVDKLPPPIQLIDYLAGLINAEAAK